MTDLSPRERRRLQDSLAAAYPWVTDTDVGPRSVEAGECDRCGRQPRLVPTCGPVAWTALCGSCAVDVGEDSWCDGHRDDGATHRAWARTLPDEWPTVTRLWWVATGEIVPDAAWLEAARADVTPR